MNGKDFHDSKNDFGLNQLEDVLDKQEMNALEIPTRFKIGGDIEMFFTENS